jgi:uncharacterized repeat protein (TIGR01451 family)
MKSVSHITKKTISMKLNLRLLIVLFYLFAEVALLPAQGWKRAYPSSATLFRSVQTPDGGFIACGVNDDLQLSVVKTDADGVILKTNTFKSINRVGKVLITKAVNGDFLIAFNDSSSVLKLLRISANGDSLGFKRLPLTLALHDIQSLAQGGFGVLGADENQKATLLKLNNLGDTVWTKKYANQVKTLSGFAEDNDGSIIWQLNDLTTGQPILLILDKSGQTLSSVNINSSILNFFQFIRLKDGNYAACTSNNILKFRSDGRLMWGVVPTFLSGSKDITRIIATDDNGIALLAYGENRVLGEMELQKLDEQATSKWKRKIAEDIESTPGTDFSLYLLFGIQECADKGFLVSGRIENAKNSITTKSGYLIKTNNEGLVYSNILRGRIAADLNQNCRIDNNEKGINGWVIKADGGTTKIFNTTTDANGNYSFQLDSGRYKLSLFAPNNLWQACFSDSILNIAGFNKTDTFNIPVKPVLTCSGLRVDIGTPILRRCFDNTYTVSYCNNGTFPVQNAYIEITLDTSLIYQSASLPLISKKGRVYRFNVGDLDILQCGSFKILTKVSCETPSVSGRTACTEAHIFPDSICPSWRGARMEVTGSCDRDSLRFNLRNTGQATTSTPINSIVIEDEVVFLKSSQIYNPGQSRTFSFKPNGRTYRLQADQERGLPTNQTSIAIAIEGCGFNNTGGISTGFVLQLPEADGDPFVDLDCQTIVSSSETNTKLATPFGYQADHLIEPNNDLEYLIRFQNVGTDTAFNIIVRDTLSEFLEPTSVEFGASSHPYRAEVIGSNVLKFTFNNARLPDSFVNVAASQGFVKFRVRQKPNLALGTKILNKAAIYFDFNAPVITSRTFHTVGKSFLVSAIIDPPKANSIPIKVYPNPFTDLSTFELVEVSPPESYKGGGLFQSISSTFKLFDAMGREVRNEKFEGSKFVFERSSLPAGMYFFTIENDGKKGTGKLIIQ